jgi:GDP-mannose pyrophosphatase NudK
MEIKNPTISIQKTEVLSDNRYVLNKVTLVYKTSDQEYETQIREVYDRGNGAVILLYNAEHKSVILTRQFRLPTYLNGNSSGMLIEACAGMLDGDNPIDCIIRETEEETGYRLSSVEKIFQSYMSPGAVTEMLHFFIGEYQSDMKISDGGGLADEHEHIEVMEFPFSEAYQMIASGEITDAKTIMLLQYAKINLPL